jgi:uncharacterized protein
MLISALKTLRGRHGGYTVAAVSIVSSTRRPPMSFRRTGAYLDDMRLRDRLDEFRESIVTTAATHGASNILLFGSVARGEEHDQSDIDFLVRLEPGRTLLDLVRLESKLEELLGRPVDVVTEASLAEPIRARALREAIRV